MKTFGTAANYSQSPLRRRFTEREVMYYDDKTLESWK